MYQQRLAQACGLYDRTRTFIFGIIEMTTHSSVVIAQGIGTLIPEATLSVSEAAQNNISCWAGGTEMLRVAQDGFYVRGVKVTQDDREAETVYNAFKQFLVWAELNRR